MLASLTYPPVSAEIEAERFFIDDLEAELGQPVAIVRPKKTPDLGVLVWKNGPNNSTLTQVEFRLESEPETNPRPVVCLCGLCKFAHDKEQFEYTVGKLDEICSLLKIRWLIVHRRPISRRTETTLIEGLQKKELAAVFEQLALLDPYDKTAIEEETPLIISQRYR